MTTQAWHRRRRRTGKATGKLEGSQCRKLRARLQVTQDELAEIAGVSVRCLRGFERGSVRTLTVTVEAVFGALQRCGAFELSRTPGVSPSAPPASCCKAGGEGRS